jgi:phenylalanine-4-hydroxylase
MIGDFNNFGNKQVLGLPAHLRQFVVSQNYADYTSVDHAVWRYVMRKNVQYLSTVADGSYVEGLRKTGITINSIPNIQSMNDILGEIGWGAVCVDGFIPPTAFMEFQAYKVLVIAADIRQLEHIEYTPAPDIIHEAAGHAPIIADPEYAEYLRLFGEIGSKAISSARDYDLYEAIRHLSIVKEDPGTPERDIQKAEEAIDVIQRDMGTPSEMSMIRNLHWWTVEYGLIGAVESPKIYGAGLLSSIGESENCLKGDVKKIPYSIAAAQVAFDITEMQPQLFVTPNYRHLTQVLEQFSDTMALRKGGTEGLKKAIESNNPATAEYSSGLQVSGIFAKVLVDDENNTIYIGTSSPTALAWQDQELVGHGKDYHADGFSSPVGKLKGEETALEQMTMEQLSAVGIRPGEKVCLQFESGVEVNGFLSNIRRNRKGANMLMTFLDCTVVLDQEVLFSPEWGVYDMAIGAEIASVFSGAADIGAFENEAYVPKETTHKVEYGAERLRLHELYQQVREVREEKQSNSVLLSVWSELKKDFPKDWLCALEVMELVGDARIETEIGVYLQDKRVADLGYAKLIADGLELLV